MTAVPEDAGEIFSNNGFAVAGSLFSRSECEALIGHYRQMRTSPWQTDDYQLDPDNADPLKRYPRLLQPHRWDKDSMEWLTDPRIDRWITALTGCSPIAVQTMVYFKPPGARGQALHQDNTYLRAAPGTCIAAWLALEACDEENGCLMVVPGTQALPVMCTEKADLGQSFTDQQTPLAPGLAPVPVRMAAGDVLFFNGSLIHGSYPNTSTSRWRQSLIGHYITGDCDHVAGYYCPAYRMDGREVALEESSGGDRCGSWVEGTHEVELVEATGVDRTVRRE